METRPLKKDMMPKTTRRTTAVLMSVKPSYANLLVNGSKTVELRRRFSDLPHGTKMLVYGSSPTSKIIGEVSIVKVEQLKLDDLWNYACQEAMISWEDFSAYFKGRDSGYAITVNKATKYESPYQLDCLKELGVKGAPQSYQFISSEYSECLT